MFTYVIYSNFLYIYNFIYWCLIENLNNSLIIEYKINGVYKNKKKIRKN